MTRLDRVISTSLFALMVGVSGSAHAQDASRANDTGASAGTGEEIIVTAQKRQQRQIDVPLAISTIGSETLTSQNLNRISDYFDRIPGLQFSGPRIAALSLRGVTTGAASSPTLAVLVDDVQFGGSTDGGQTPIPDFDGSTLQRIEVLRGPQGTLYGASSLGGLIKYVLKEPSLDKLSGRVEVGGTHISHGNEGWVARGSVNAPLTDWLAVTASGFYRDDAAWLDNVNARARDARDTNTRKVWGGRAAALIQPAPNLKFVLSGLYQKQKAINSDLSTSSGGVPICRACQTDPTARVTTDPVFGDLTLNSLDSFNNAKYQMYSARGEWDLDQVKLTSITAWSRSDNSLSNDVTSTFRPLFLRPFSYGAAYAGGSVTIDNADYTHKFSQELRATGTVGIVDWLVGGFYTVEHSGVDQSLTLADASGGQAVVPYIAEGPDKYREYAGFADATVHLTDKFEVQFGGRYAQNKRTSSSAQITTPQAAVFFGPSSVTAANSKDNAFTWLISPTYHFSRDIMVYARIATGYRPGGPNIDTTVTSSYGPDRVTNYEVGFKGVVVPGVLTIDTALFQIDWKNIQLGGTAESGLTFTANGDTARSRGWEFSANLTPWQGMTVSGNFALTDAELTATLVDLGEGSLVGRSGTDLPFTAKFTTSVSADQTLPLNDRLTATLGASFTHVGDRPGGLVSNLATRPRLEIPGYSTVDLRAGLDFDQVWSLSVYVRNVFDKRGVTFINDRNGTSTPNALYVMPRSFGLTVARDF
ncbi:outer membrane receptor protein involved in Fe transport [Novosphingobium chloroacetimidivorans]|uniref:Outer membrane receptor protein involved in Fe transport n=1 Tax=Novosphingobium chloroacetimidivorans TaxID=1428314 RepID=A0A7W7NUX0_9SPHN|nr:TonB-dependent receptor [Novosphingobium chloroacetimidivorans]MBB4857948.1 outer membrane receptor protein involved in Fe transport [Novosphingobium chloroacetimidivorans]